MGVFILFFFPYLSITFTHTLSVVHRLPGSRLCVFSVFACQTCTRVFFNLCFQPRGATLAPPELSTPPTLLGQQVKAEYTYSVPPGPHRHLTTHSVGLGKPLRCLSCLFVSFSFPFQHHASFCYFFSNPFLSYFFSSSGHPANLAVESHASARSVASRRSPSFTLTF